MFTTLPVVWKSAASRNDPNPMVTTDQVVLKNGQIQLIV
jgi:hypothetical protein